MKTVVKRGSNARGIKAKWGFMKKNQFKTRYSKGGRENLNIRSWGSYS